MDCYEGQRQAAAARREVRALRAQLRERREKAGPAADALAALDRKAAALEGGERGPRGGGRRGPVGGEPSLGRVAGELGSLLGLLQEADAAPTTQAVAAVEAAKAELAGLLRRWKELKEQDGKALEGK